jgi:hypothetical protein
MRHLRALVFEAGKFENWATFLPFVQRIINSTVNDSIGVAPVQLLMPGVDLDRQISATLPMTDVEATAEQALAPAPTAISPWMQNVIDVQARLIRVAQRRTDLHAATHAPPIDPAIPNVVTVFAPNTFVWVSYPDGQTKGRPPNKFNTQLKGPHRVLSSVGPHFEIMNLVTNKVEKVHVSRLRQYHSHEQSPEHLTVAAKDYEEFLVESILAHAGNPKRYGSMEFLVRWAGYGPEDDMYLPWKELRNNPILHEYLFQNGLINIIPKEHRAPYRARA